MAPLPVGGADLEARGMKPGPDMGAALAIMERAWVESEFCLSKDALLERIFH